MMPDHIATLAELHRLLGDARDRIAALTRQADRNPRMETTLRQFIEQRRLRSHCFGSGLFSDPAWDILLELAVAHLNDEAIPISAIAAAADVPATTALRWINVVVDRGLAVRLPDTRDRRRVYVRLSESGWEKMRRYLEHAGVREEV